MNDHSKEMIALWFSRMARGMEKYLDKRINTFEEFDEYCYYVGGTVGGLLTDLVIKNTRKASPVQRKALVATRNHFGLFLQKVNIIRDFREDMLSNEKIFWPQALFRQHGIAPEDALKPTNSKKSLAILERMIENSRSHVNHVVRYIKSIPRDFSGYRDFSIINFLMAVETLNRLDGNGDVFYSDSPVKIGSETKKMIISDPVKCFDNFSF